MKSQPDVLIAGAGPTGLTLACGLLANGVAARVVDKQLNLPGLPGTEWGREVTAPEQDSGGVTVSFADGGQSRVSHHVRGIPASWARRVTADGTDRRPREPRRTR
jgi:predicted NAD/FAD-dependent oxidoreductase